MAAAAAVAAAAGRTAGRSAARLLGGSRRGLHATGPAWGRILCCDNIDPVCVDIFREKGHQADVKNKLSVAELHAIIGDYDGMVVRSATKVTKEMLEHATNLKVVGRAGVGIDNINVNECTKAGVLVMNTPGGNTVSTAQLAISLLCVAARRISEADISMKAGKWERKKFMGTELSGKTLAIVGCGRIGQVVAEWAQGFSMDVIGYDPAMPKEVAEAKGITLMELDDIWARADFITLHTPLTPETKDLVNDDSIAKMKKGVIIVNCARGGIINEDALLRGLQSGQVGSAALDVYSSEPPPESLRPLLEHDRVVCTPHLGASTEEAQVNVARDVALQMCDTLAGSDYVGVVNVSYMALANEPEMKPYLQLAEVIGKMHSQLHGDGDKVKSIKVHCYGGTSVSIESTQARQVLQAQVLKGVMAFHPGNTTVPSLINAPFLAKEHGVECVIDKKVHPRLLSSPYSNAITVDVVLESGRHRSISGSVFGTQGNIVQIDNYKGFPSFTPEGTLLSFRNVDKPGAVGGVLKILSEAGVNVGRMNVGRQDGDLALCLLDLDQMPSQQTIQKLRDLDTLKEVSLSNIS